jgi:signal transduction histidine kinase
LLLSLLADVILVCYGAYAYGVLLSGAKRMAEGNLSAKISTRFLVGPFACFAIHLNALADVAVIAAEKQLRSERMKTELITNVSHDIKTPLTSIINYIDLLEKPHTEPEGKQYLEVLGRQSQRMKKLIEDLMEMSKASSGNIPVHIQQIDAAETVNQALGEFSDKLEVAGLIPVFQQPEAAVPMLADGRLAWRVLSNLLSNVVKYALPGTRVYADIDTLPGQVQISLKNISREPLNISADELTERFVRGDTSRNTEGSGLGLNIAKSLMDLQKGRLELVVDGDLFKVTLIFPAE